MPFSNGSALFSEAAVTLPSAIIVRGHPHCQCRKNLFLSDFLVLTFFLKALPTVSALILANHPEYLQLSYLCPWKLAMQKRNTCLQKIHLLSVRQSGGIDSRTRPCYTGRNSTTFCKGRFFYGAQLQRFYQFLFQKRFGNNKIIAKGKTVEIHLGLL